MSPYREPTEPEEPATDAELDFWELTALAVVALPNGHSKADDICDFADAMLKRRRKRFGVR